MIDINELHRFSVERVEAESGEKIDLRAPLKLMNQATLADVDPGDVSLVRLCKSLDTQFGSLRPRGSQLQRKQRRPAFYRFMKLFTSLARQYSYADARGPISQMYDIWICVYDRLGRGTRYSGVKDKHLPTLLRCINLTVAMYDRLRSKYALHPAVIDALKICAPRSMRVLLMQYPSQSSAMDGALTYSQTLHKIDRDIRTRTTVGKYLREHFPQLTDLEIRDIVAKHAVPSDLFGIVRTMDSMLRVLQYGPSSCMHGSADDFNADGMHPYNVYDPSMGWAMAYMRASTHADADPMYNARALVNDESKTFVRTYKRCPNGGYSHASEELHQWLLSQGYKHASSWYEHRVARIPLDRGGYVMPYIDGGEQNVYGGDVDWLSIGETPQTPRFVGCADNTDGTVASAARYTCHCCGDTSDDDDGWMPLDHSYSDVVVCDSCWGSSLGTSREYVRHACDDYVIARDEATYLSGYGWHHTGDDCVFYCDYSEEYVHENHTFVCDHDGLTYSEEHVAHKLINGDTVANHNIEDYVIAQLRDNCDYAAFVEVVNDCGTMLLSADCVRAIEREIADGDFPWDDEDVVDAYQALAQAKGMSVIERPQDDDEDDEAADTDSAAA